MFDAAEAALGGVDVLVNNAGIMTISAVADTTDAAFDREVAVNLKCTFNLLREATKRLRPGGRIINFSSSIVGLLQPDYAAYAATKVGVEAMTSILAKELRGRARADRNGTVSGRQTARGRRPSGQACAAGAVGSARRHRRGGCLSRWC
jgi:NAD(P)-dependent dehydrogenase (short-subunit alcohol dehydrogenase family)